MAYLAAEKHLDLSVLHGDRTNTVAKKGAMALGIRGYKHQKGEIITAHAGEITVQSVEGQGTTFTLLLPLAGA